MKKRGTSVFLSFFILLTGIVPGFLSAQRYCIAGRFSETPLFALPDLKTDTGIVYGYAFNPFTGQTEALKMDLVYPDMGKDTMSRRPLVVSVHSGGFSGGSRQINFGIAAGLAQRGYVSATIDYRLGWNCTGSICPDCIEDTLALRQSAYMASQDLSAAVRYLAGNAAEYHINPAAVFLNGSSAGAMACFLFAFYDQQQLNAFAPGAKQVLGLRNEGGNTFPANYSVLAISSLCGAVPGNLNNLSQVQLPVISFHDENDCFVPYGTGPIFGCECAAFFPCLGPSVVYNHLLSQGQCAGLYTMPGSSAHCSFPDSDVVSASACFFKQVLCKTCSPDSAYGSPVPVSCDSLRSAN